ncbi:MAG: TIGR03067 domain-containing protein [Verrucomicrobia bacterium]|nr:TIGR03067 domain-containing protein [Verrucomicrobiota bacterium]
MNRKGFLPGLFTCGVVLVLLCAGSLAPAADTPQERQKLIGVWSGGVVEGDGSKAGSTRVVVSELVITADKITAKNGEGASLGEGTYKLGDAGGLKTIDASGTGGPTHGKSYVGIYKVEGDTLKWCSGTPGKPRPTFFKSEPSNGFLMIVTRKK